jgi:hypothetical protein
MREVGPGIDLSALVAPRCNVMAGRMEKRTELEEALPRPI